ncbi:MAG: hypothetical protein WBD20_22620 [Pirellulaceae bacterium]
MKPSIAPNTHFFAPRGKGLETNHYATWKRDRCRIVASLALAAVATLTMGQGFTFAQSDGSDADQSQSADTDYGADYGGEMDDMYMEMDDSMGRDGGYPSSRGTAKGGDPNLARMEVAQEALQSMLTSMDLSPLSAPAESIGVNIQAGPELRNDAETAYKSGNYPAAMQIFFSHMVTEYDQARVALQTVKYSRLLRRPVWQIRWGVSYMVRGEEGVTDFSPILAGKTTPMQNGNGGRPGMDNEDMGMSDYPGSETDYSGSGSDDMEMEMGMEMEMEMGMSDPMGRGGPNRGANSPMALAPVSRKMLDDGASEQMNKYLGLVAEVVEREFTKRYRQSDFGTALNGVAATGPENAEPVPAAHPGTKAALPTTSLRGPVDELLARCPETATLWTPGLMFFGQTESKEAIEAARLDQVDFLLHFDVILKVNRNQQTQNISRCRLISTATGKSLTVSKPMDSLEVSQLVRAGRTSEQSYVEEQLANLFMVIDRDIKTTEMPKLTAEIAKKRVGTILSASPENRLRALSEVRLYQTQELLTVEDVATAFEILGGEEGLALLYGPLEQKMSIAREWVVAGLGRSK